MEAIPPFVYLMLAVGAFAVTGGLIIWAIGYGRDKETQEEHEWSPPGALPEDLGSPWLPGDQELLRVSRTEQGELTVYVQGQQYRSLRGITDRQVGRETVEAIKAVMTFAEGWLPTLQHEPSQPDFRRPAVDEETFLEQLRRSNLFSLDSPPQPSLSEPVIPVERINELVQELLQKRLDMAGRDVRLITKADGSLRIYVDQRTFDAVGDVSDPEARALIQDAIREWENS
jgi:hypothetical protein